MDVLETTVQTLQRCLSDLEHADLGRVFAPGFLAQLPAAELRARLAHMLRELGDCTHQVIAARTSERSARIRLEFARGYVAEGTVAVNDEQPPRIQWLLFDLPTRRADTWRDIEAEVRALSGRVSFEVRDLSRGTVLAAVEPGLALGVGSVSKLLLLSAVLDAVSAGRSRWEDILRLEPADRSLPTGILQDWASGAPLTLHTAATLLISISDNTAADLLLRAIGRAPVEAIMRRLPLDTPEANQPFLSTRGLFALLVSPEAEREAYKHAPEAERRARLKAAEERPLPDVSQISGPWPEGFDWYLSAHAVCALLDILRAQIGPSPLVRGLFGTQTGGLRLSDWRFAGFKGGASPGRVAFSLLLEDDGGRWASACLIDNATPETLDVELCARLLKRAADQARAELAGG